MKRFKKVLALVLAGVLALAMLTACDGTTDPDKIMPDDGTVEVVMTINNTAANKGLGQVEYSAKYSAVTKALLENWLEWRTNGNQNTKYREEYEKITAELGNVKIVVGLTDKNVIPGLTSGNPAVKGSAKYDVLFKDTSAYNLADRIGVAFVKTENSAGLTTTYQLVCLFDVN